MLGAAAGDLKSKPSIFHRHSERSEESRSYDETLKSWILRFTQNDTNADALQAVWILACRACFFEHVF